jgi:hypothetical protein
MCRFPFMFNVLFLLPDQKIVGSSPRQDGRFHVGFMHCIAVDWNLVCIIIVFF